MIDHQSEVVIKLWHWIRASLLRHTEGVLGRARSFVHLK